MSAVVTKERIAEASPQSKARAAGVLWLMTTLSATGGCASAAISFAFRLVPLVVLEGAQYLTVFTVEQLQALVLTSFRLGAQTSNISFAFFGLSCLLAGCLITTGRITAGVTTPLQPRGTAG